MPSRTRLSRPAVAARLVGAWVVIALVVTGWGLLLTHPLARTVGGPDNDVSRWFADQRTPTLGTLAEIGTFVGETVVGAIVLVVAGLAFALWQRSARPLVFVVVMYGGLGVLYVVVTHLVTRDRPPVKILDAGLIPTHSFPSGHVGTAVAVAGCLIALATTYRPAVGRWTWLLLVIPVATLLARLYQGAHHLTDVLTSVVYATTWLLVTARLLLGPVREDR